MISSFFKPVGKATASAGVKRRAGSSSAIDTTAGIKKSPAKTASSASLPDDFNGVHPSWYATLAAEVAKPYWAPLQAFVAKQRASCTVYPPSDEVYTALQCTPLDQVKVVILGQDPYHGPGQAHGLAFSVRKGVRIPPSLRNMYKEAESCVGMAPPKHGDLTRWAKQGVLLLNTVLTVRGGAAHSHAKQGWEKFTDAIIQAAAGQSNVVFMLWGKPAQSKKKLIHGAHLILESPHPSPLSAHRGFLGNRHFALANEYLRNHDKAEIDWAVDGPLPAGPAKRAAADAAEAGAAAAADAAAEVTPEARPEAASETPGAASPASPE